MSPVPVWRDKVIFRKTGAKIGSAGRSFTEKDINTAISGKGRRTVERPAPRIFIPQPPSVAIKGARPSLRHHLDGLFDDEGRLRCRYPNETVKGITGVVNARDLVPTLGSGAIPPEVLAIVQEAMVLNPYCSNWLAGAAAESKEIRPQLQNRIEGEMLRVFSMDGRYDGSGEYTLQASLVSPQASATQGWHSATFAESAIRKPGGRRAGPGVLYDGLPPKSGGGNRMAATLGSPVAGMAGRT